MAIETIAGIVRTHGRERPDVDAIRMGDRQVTYGELDRASSRVANALAAAEFLRSRADVEAVHYPGLRDHPDHALARRQFGDAFGSIVTFTLRGGTAAAERFIAAARRIPFCPSLGDLSTTLSHPESTSHRGMTPAERARLGIAGGTIRLSVGIESAEAILDALAEGLAGGA